MEKQARAVSFYFKTCHYLAVFRRLSRKHLETSEVGGFIKP